MPRFRSVVSVLVRFVVRSSSTNSRPAPRAASGPATTRRPPGNRPHPPHQPEWLFLAALLAAITLLLDDTPNSLYVMLLSLE